MRKLTRCYFDIETSSSMELTVAGMYLETGKLIQLVGNEITSGALKGFFKNTIIYTYNGSRFDLPMIKKSLGLDVQSVARTHDLMYDCWAQNLRGGLKEVERKLGIYRSTMGMNGYDAVKLWDKYILNGDIDALELLLKYNMEDVKNLEIVRKELGVE